MDSARHLEILCCFVLPAASAPRDAHAACVSRQMRAASSPWHGRDRPARSCVPGERGPDPRSSSASSSSVMPPCRQASSVKSSDTPSIFLRSVCTAFPCRDRTIASPSGSGSSLSRPCLRWQASRSKLRTAFSGSSMRGGREPRSLPPEILKPVRCQGRIDGCRRNHRHLPTWKILEQDTAPNRLFEVSAQAPGPKTRLHFPLPPAMRTLCGYSTRRRGAPLGERRLE